jgi:uncharacterized membrane protein
MQDWDRLVFVLLGGGVAVYTGYLGWRAWREQHKSEAVGAVLLALATVVVPIVLAMLGT